MDKIINYKYLDRNCFYYGILNIAGFYARMIDEPRQDRKVAAVI